MRSFRQFLSSALGGYNTHNGKRNYNDIYGYPDSLAGIDGFLRMWHMCKRTGIANRLTAGMARQCWRQGLELWANSEKDASQLLIDDLSLLKRSNIFNYIERADTLNRIGRFSVLLVGIPDGRELGEEVGKVAAGNKMLDKVWYRPFAYDSIEVASWDNEPTSPRYGMPQSYTLLANPREELRTAGAQKSITAHWSRVVHLNEQALESDYEGMGYIEPIYNVLLNLEKVCGGSAEAYFRNAKGKLVFELDKEFADFFNENPSAEKAHQEKVEDFTNSYRDQISVSGAKATSLDTPMYTPKDTIVGNLWIVSGYSGYPVRALTGEGSGQYAGSEDRLAVNSLVQARQDSFCYEIALQVLERLSLAGMLSLPDEYDVRFPLQEETSTDQEVKNNSVRAETFKKVAETIRGLGTVDPTSAFAFFGFDDIDMLEDVPTLIDESQDEFDEQPDENENDRS